MHPPTLRTLTTALVALMVPVTILASVATAAYFKSTNPDNVDITNGLAYLQYTVVVAVAIFSLFTLAITGGIVRLYRREYSFHSAKLPLTLLLAVILLMAAVFGLNAYTSKVQDQYLIDNGRPTLQQFFDELEKQKKD